jgi:hypothetical protein
MQDTGVDDGVLERSVHPHDPGLPQGRRAGEGRMVMMVMMVMMMMRSRRIRIIRIIVMTGMTIATVDDY